MKELENKANEIIQTLRRGNFYAECSCCGTEVSLKDAGLFFGGNLTPEAQILRERQQAEAKSNGKELRLERKNISAMSERAAVASNLGKIVERFAPSLPDFRFDKNDCRSLFDPIDYIIFNGLDKKGFVESITFAEIKTGNGRLNGHQKEIRALVGRKKVAWKTYKTR